MSDAQTLAPPKRGRGRPRKSPTEIAMSAAPQTLAPPKRGRPRKYRPPRTSAMATPPPPASAALPGSGAKELVAVEGLASFTGMLSAFLHRWNALLVDKPLPSAAELASICEQMGSLALRRFATANLRDRAWLRRVGPHALLRAPDPAALILRAVDRYYICAEGENDEAACVLLLELYVRAGCPRLPASEEEEEARVAALSWRSRIVRDKGRVADATTRDARGLVLLMAAFGVPTEFPVQDLYDLLIAGDCFAWADVLKCSNLFVTKLRDVVADMLNRGSYREAIGVILEFELQNVFPLPDILTHMVEKDQGTEGQGNLAGSVVSAPLMQTYDSYAKEKQIGGQLLLQTYKTVEDDLLARCNRLTIDSSSDNSSASYVE